MMKATLRIFPLLALTIILLFPSTTFAHPCSGGTEVNTPLVSLGNGTSQISPNVAAGEYFLFYVCNGASYDFHTRPENSFDTYITLINDATLAFIADNNDFCGTPIADQASVSCLC